ncbi:MAG: peptidoglycan-binding protein [Actinomycetia bacterium]|nr:peptidoglycan-binding protein [Actinomycetes bacterium]
MRRAIVIGGVCVATVAAIAVVARDDADGAGSAASVTSPDPANSELSTVVVEQRDLVNTESFTGTVGHGDQRKLGLSANGTITQLPTVGDVIEFGAPLAEVDGKPVLLLEGDRPQWRPLAAGAKGADVAQLEAALVALGYADANEVTVDETWTASTTAAVKRMQRSTGMTEDGRLAIGEIVFWPDEVRIANVADALGAAATTAGLEVTGLEQSVRVLVGSSKLSLIQVGDQVVVELPTGETVAGTVQRIESARVAEDGAVTFPIIISTAALEVEDGISVKVKVNDVLVAAATAVPADALLALAEGGYAVEVPDSSSANGTRLVAVEIGEFADGWVAVTGAIEPGDTVVVP